MRVVICDKCGKDITKSDKRYVVATSKSEPNEKGECKPDDWLMIKEVCVDCMKEIQRLFE